MNGSDEIDGSDGKVVALPESEDLGRAQALAEETMAKRALWEEAWKERMILPCRLEPVPPEFAGPGSVVLMCGDRQLAHFIVQYDEATGLVEVRADWPKE